MQLERDLERAGIAPFAWIVNMSLGPLPLRDPLLRARQALEPSILRELAGHAERTIRIPWKAVPIG
jgi:arsenite-transporting ATPase